MNKDELKKWYARRRQDLSSRKCFRCDQVKPGTKFRLHSRVCNDCRARRQREDLDAIARRRKYRSLDSTKARRKELDAIRKAEDRRRDVELQVKTCKSCKLKKPWSYFEPHDFGVHNLTAICSKCREAAKDEC